MVYWGLFRLDLPDHSRSWFNPREKPVTKAQSLPWLLIKNQTTIISCTHYFDSPALDSCANIDQFAHSIARFQYRKVTIPRSRKNPPKPRRFALRLGRIRQLQLGLKLYPSDGYETSAAICGQQADEPPRGSPRSYFFPKIPNGLKRRLLLGSRSCCSNESVAVGEGTVVGTGSRLAEG